MILTLFLLLSLATDVNVQEERVETWMLEPEWLAEKDIVVEEWMHDNETWNVSLDK